ncbi:serine hydrolase domain-containing protein [Aquabacterium sp.]|uniref:serine hydrolase domain-containing protein n=1 Tax=Aquabacterium sp. TaxID=1872578 RepID=UPI003784B3C3
MAMRFDALHAAMQRHVDAELLPGVSCAVLVGRDLVDEHCAGWADREQRVPLRRDHLFRVFSNTKLLTSCAALLLWEDGHFQLDDPVERWLPALANRRVLKPGATRLDDTEPARSPITVRQLLSHSSGLSYGLLDPGSLLFEAYGKAQIMGPLLSLAEMVERLGALPLAYHPGTGWEYSIATDVVARLVEVISGQRFGDFLATRILQPLGMHDTGFVLTDEQRGRLTAIYAGADLMAPMTPGLTRTDDYPYPGAYLRPVPKQSGGGGLVSSLPDMVTLLQALRPGGDTLLKPATLALLFENQLAPGVWINFAGMGSFDGHGYSLGGGLTVQRWAGDPADAVGDLHWGGLAGTHWWISPQDKVAAVAMTQRQWGFSHPYWLELKALIRQAVRS